MRRALVYSVWLTLAIHALVEPPIKKTVFSQEDGVLQPPDWNLAKSGATITASTTCGQEKTADYYCKIFFNDCNYCLAQSPDQTRRHPIENVINGRESYWMSPPLSRGQQYQRVNITIDLHQPFHVAYVTIKYAISPRAKTWVLERSVDGVNWLPWQYFARDVNGCQQFGLELTRGAEFQHDSSVICTNEHTELVPATDGEVIVSLINGRPSQDTFSRSEELQEFTRASKIRIRLLELNTLYGHLMSPDLSQEVMKRYFYAIKNIEIGGRCVCNGHAETCLEQDGEFHCQCEHNTTGRNCDQCKPNFVQKKWKPGVPGHNNTCEPCNCHQHSDKCVYDESVDEKRASLDISGNYEGGGVCQKCTGNTEGNNCERCQAGFFRDHNAPKTNDCQPCNCNLEHSNGNCDPRTGQCECEKNFGGLQCSACAPKLFYYPKCDREFQCDECTHDLMETILPETDKIKTAVEELHNVKAHKLAYRRYQKQDEDRDDIEHSIALISAGIDLSENVDDRLDEVRNDICGKQGEAARWDAIIKNMRVDFKDASVLAEKISMDADSQRSRAESVQRDFEDVAEMSDAEYERRMVPAREDVATLEQIYIHNDYKPLLQMAEAERTESVALLNKVKEHFGGGETTGRCHGDREPKDFSKHRLQPATVGNFDFIPGDISKIDSDGNEIGHIDNSHIYDEGYDQYETSDTYEISDRYSTGQYEPNEYDDEEEEVVDPPLVPPETNEFTESPMKQEKLFSDNKKPTVDPLGYQLSTKAGDNLGLGATPCAATGKMPAIVPNMGSKDEVENILMESDENEAYIGLKATVGVPLSSWRWEPQLWRKFLYRGGWSEESTDPTKRCTVMTKDGWKAEKCEELLATYICLGRDQRRKYRYFIQHGEPVNYYGAAKACANLGYLLAVVPTEKTHLVLVNYVQQQKVERAWIGLRAEGAETEVTWTWSNGRTQSNELLNPSEMRQANILAANEQKRCMIVKRANGKLSWQADLCEVSRPFMCSNNPRSDMYDAPLSRGKRNLNVLVHDLQRAKRDPLEALNDKQNSPSHHPKDAQFAPLDTLVQDVINEEYPATSSLADQLECVVFIEEKAVTTSNKLGDLERKIQESIEITDAVNDQLDGLDLDLQNVEDNINAIKGVSDDLDTARTEVDQAARLTNDATDYMRELEEISPADLKLDEDSSGSLASRVEDYQSHDWDNIQQNVNDARAHKEALFKKYLELLELFSTANSTCTIHDNDFVDCDIGQLTQLGPLIADAWNKISEAMAQLLKSSGAMEQARDLKNNFVGCDDIQAKRALDSTAAKNQKEQIMEKLKNLDMDKFEEYDWTEDDLAIISTTFDEVQALYVEIYGMLFGKTEEPPYTQEPKDQWGVYGAFGFLKNPGCWYLTPPEVCNFQTDFEDTQNTFQSGMFFDKYEEIVEEALNKANRLMNGKVENGENVDLKMDYIEIMYDDLTQDNSDPDEVQNSLNEIEGTISDIKHLIASTRSLLERVPLQYNAQQFEKSDFVEPHVEVNDFGDSRYHFEVDINVRLRAANNNLLYFGNTDNFVTIDTKDAFATAVYTVDGHDYKIQSEDKLGMGQDSWYTIHFEKMGRRLSITASCYLSVGNTCSQARAEVEIDGRTDADGGRRRKKRRRKRRHRKSSTKRSTRFPRDAADGDDIKSTLFLPIEHTKWDRFNSICNTMEECAVDPEALRAIIGNYKDDTTTPNSVDYAGYDGDINGLRVNGHLVTPWHFKQGRKSPDSQFIKVKIPLEEREECWSDKSQKFEKDAHFSAKFECPCLDGRNSYVMVDHTGIDLTFRDKLHAFMQFTPIGSSDSYVLAAMFTESAYILVEKNNTGFDLVVKADADSPEIVSRCNYFPPQEDNLITLKFGIIQTQGSSKKRNAGILQFTDSFRPRSDDIPVGENGHQVDMEDETWAKLRSTLEGQPLFIGGIPKHLLTKQMKELLGARNLLEYYGTDQENDFDVKSMGACFRRININWDDKNRKNEGRFLGVIDGHGIYRHNKIPTKKDINIVPGKNLKNKSDVFNPIKLNGKHITADKTELSFGIMFATIGVHQTIMEFNNDLLEMDEAGHLSVTIAGKNQVTSATMGKTDVLRLFVIQTSDSGTDVSVVGEDLALDEFKLHFEDKTDLHSLKVGGDPFTGKLLQPRLQTETQSIDLLNGSKDTDTPGADRFACLSKANNDDERYNCNNMQYNTYYTFN